MKLTQTTRLLPAALLFSAALAACGSAQTAQPPTTASTAVAPAIATAQPTTAAPAIATAQPTAGTASEPVATPSTAESLAIGNIALAEAKRATPDKPVIVGVTGVAGDYAAALAQVVGEQPQYVYLRRDASDWKAIDAQQAPESLKATSDAQGAVAALAAQLQAKGSSGLEGFVLLEKLVDGYARLVFSPADPATVDGFTSFRKHEGNTWKQLTGGTAFDAASLKELGIPQALWTGPDA